MKKLLLALMIVTTPVWAGDNPYEVFDASKKETDEITIKWLTVDDVPAACRAMDAKYGTQLDRGRAIACSFWTKNTCTIITNKKTTTWSLGHEARHCFQGNWH
jgi:hypothetical protein